MGDDKYVKNVADSYERTWQDGRPVNPATRDVFERITQQPPLVDPAVNEDIRIRNEVGKHIASQNPPKAKDFVDDVTGGWMGDLTAATVGASIGSRMGPLGAAAGAAAGTLVKAAWDHRNELYPERQSSNDDLQTPMPPNNTEMPGTEMKPRNNPEHSKY